MKSGRLADEPGVARNNSKVTPATALHSPEAPAIAYHGFVRGRYDGEIKLGDHFTVTTQGRDALADLRKAYVGLGDEFSRMFRFRCDALKSADELFDRYPEEIGRALDLSRVFWVLGLMG